MEEEIEVTLEPAAEAFIADVAAMVDDYDRDAAHVAELEAKAVSLEREAEETRIAALKYRDAAHARYFTRLRDAAEARMAEAEKPDFIWYGFNAIENSRPDAERVRSVIAWNMDERAKNVEYAKVHSALYGDRRRRLNV